MSEHWIGRVETTLINHLKSWGEWKEDSPVAEWTQKGHKITDFHIEQQLKGNYLLLATIDGKSLKYIIRKGTLEHDSLTKTGLAHITKEMRQELVERFLIPKVII